jgi:hypothetical protein
MSNAADLIDPNNPGNATSEPARNRAERVPMSVPVRRLETPEIPGYHSHWFKESNISRALQAWYEFVGFDEVPVNQRNVGTDTMVSGNTDLGSHVSISAGIDGQGKPERLTLMKLKEEYWLADRAKIDGRNASILGSIFRGEKILGSETDKEDDQGTRYVDRERTKALFNRRRAKV